MTNYFLNKYKIKIPKNTKILYCSDKNLLTVLGANVIKTMKLKLKLGILQKKNLIFVTKISAELLSNVNKKNIKSLRGTTTALIKQLLVEASIVTYKKLKFIGIGYKTFSVDKFENQLMLMKLGFSHPIYFKIPKNLSIFCLKQTKIFIYGSEYQYLSQTASQIQQLKFPEPYKGKGILYDNTKIKLKEGKKT